MCRVTNFSPVFVFVSLKLFCLCFQIDTAGRYDSPFLHFMYRRTQGSYFTVASPAAAAPQSLKEQYIVSICILIKCSKIGRVGFVTLRRPLK